MIGEYVDRVRGLNRDIKLLLVAIMIFNFAFMGILPVLFNVYILRLGYGPEAIGLINGLLALASAVVAVPAGLAAERIGCRSVMAGGALSVIAGTAAAPIAGLLSGPAMTLLLCPSSSLNGAGMVMFIVACTPFMVALTHDAERIFAFSARAVIDGIFALLGSVVAGLLPGLLSGIRASSPYAAYQTSLVLAPFSLVFMLMFFLRMRDERSPSKTKAGNPQPEATAGANETSLRRNGIARRIIFVALIWLIARSVFGVIRPFFTVYLDISLNVAPSSIGLIIGIAQIGATLGAFLIPYFTSRFGLRKAISVYMVVAALGLATISAVAKQGGAFVGMFISRTAFSMFFSSYLMCSQAVLPNTCRSRASGILYLAAGIGMTAASSGGGFIVAVAGYRSVFWLGAALMLASGTILSRVRLDPQQRG